MPMKEYLDFMEEWEKDFDSRPRHPRAASIKRRRERAEAAQLLVESSDNSEGGFNPTFHASRHEREWILTYLSPFYNDHLITDVLRQVKGGKEATVYCCAAHPGTERTLIAAKVYRPRMFRNLRNDAVYRQGRAVLDAAGKVVHDQRELRALQKNSAFAQQARQTSWLVTEYETLRRLYDAGAAVPQPLAHSENAILMEYLGEPELAAPILHQVRLTRDEVQPLFEQIIGNIRLFLEQDLIHADLSAHNILYWNGTVKIIDFPQAVPASQNPEAFDLLLRDVRRVCEYFARYDVAADPLQIATDFWTRYVLIASDIATGET
jgi:RIO kinase 1